MFYSKAVYMNGKCRYIAIDITKLSDKKYQITDIYYSKNGRDYRVYGSIGDRKLVYVIPKQLGNYSKLLLNNKCLKSCEIGTFTWYYIDDNNVLPIALVDSAIENFNG